MQAYPLLRLPSPAPSEKSANRRGFVSNLQTPSRKRQVERLAPLFGKLTEALEDRDGLAGLRDDPSSIAPERAIVFEVAGPLRDFYAQARKLGLEYLGESEEEVDPTGDFYLGVERRQEKKISARLYLAMPDERSLKELLKLWKLFREGKPLPHGTGQWKELFSLLIEVRPWGPQDRVPAETVSFWRGELEEHPEKDVRFEVELWYYEDRSRRRRSFGDLEEKVGSIGGEIVDHAVIQDIRYHAALVDVPAGQVQRLIDHPDITLAMADEIMFLRPQSVAHVPSKDDAEDGEEEGKEDIFPDPDISRRKPVAALLDGFPAQNHARLAGRLIIDDPDDLEPVCLVENRVHGTEMSSLIIHGDLNGEEPPIPRPLFVLPVMRPDGRGTESLLPDRLFVDVVYRAVKRIKEGDGGQPASAPDVILINLSLGDRCRPFAGVVSPLARLLDHLAYRYGVQFLVSAGNVTDQLVVSGFGTLAELENASPDLREKLILNAVNDSKIHRTLLSPAEAINVLTVGAANSGSAFAGHGYQGLVDPFTDEELPSIVSAMGLGYRKTVKPDLLVEGGRTPVRFSGRAGEDSIKIAPARSSERFFGIKVATPGKSGSNRAERFSHGTSVATALATRAAHRIHDVLVSGEGEDNSSLLDIPQEYLALAVRTLLVHGSRWGPKGSEFDATFEPQGRGKHIQRRDNIARLLGYGVPGIDRVVGCAENRATLLGWGTIDPESSLLYRIPLPPDLDGLRASRVLTLTLAWFSPINMRHQGYRAVALDTAFSNGEKYWPVPHREQDQPSDRSVRRGTILHERRCGGNATNLIDEGHLMLNISCRNTAGKHDESVPYAIAVSFEVEIESGIAVYEQVRSRVAAQIQAETDSVGL